MSDEITLTPEQIEYVSLKYGRRTQKKIAKDLGVGITKLQYNLEILKLSKPVPPPKEDYKGYHIRKVTSTNYFIIEESNAFTVSSVKVAERCIDTYLRRMKEYETDKK